MASHYTGKAERGKGKGIGDPGLGRRGVDYGWGWWMGMVDGENRDFSFEGSRYAVLMQLTLSSPALLFPTVSLLLLAYTNRFLTLATLIRALYKEYHDECDAQALKQIHNLRFRLVLIRWMQACGVLSLLACTLCLLMIFEGWMALAEWVFMGSLVLMVVSLIFSLWEIQMSTQALDIVLSDLESKETQKGINRSG